MQEVLADSVGIGSFGLAICGYNTLALCSISMFSDCGMHTELSVVISCNTSVVDQKVDAIGLLGREILCELNRTFLGRNVAGKRMQTTRASVVRLDCVLEDLLPSSGDIDLRSIGDQCLCDHETNTSASSSDNGGDMGYIE